MSSRTVSKKPPTKRMSQREHEAYAAGQRETAGLAVMAMAGSITALGVALGLTQEAAIQKIEGFIAMLRAEPSAMADLITAADKPVKKWAKAIVRGRAGVTRQ